MGRTESYPSFKSTGFFSDFFSDGLPDNILWAGFHYLENSSYNNSLKDDSDKR